MKYWFSVSYRHSESTYCTNLCFAETKEDVEEFYRKKSDWVSVTPASDKEVIAGKRKGMPTRTL